MDNHYAVDFSPKSKSVVTLDAFAANFKELDLPYHWWKMEMGGMV
jgi:hypothetical protein